MENISSSGQPAERGLNLASLFNVAAQALSANQSALNQADTENQNHGDNMVQTFSMITQALGSHQNASPSEQLTYASQALAQNGTSGSSQVYAQGLAQAAQQLQGQSAVTPDNAMQLIQSLFGGGQPAAPQGGADLLGSLLGGGQVGASEGGGLLGSLLGGGQPGASQGGVDLLGSLLGGRQQAASQGGPADLLGSLLGGGQAAEPQPAEGQPQGGLDLGDLLNAGMSFMSARQQGQSTLQAAMTAMMAAGPMGQKPHRQQSGELVANAMLQAISAFAGRK